jgi:hypothetical protein
MEAIVPEDILLTVHEAAQIFKVSRTLCRGMVLVCLRNAIIEEEL